MRALVIYGEITQVIDAVYIKLCFVVFLVCVKRTKYCMLSFHIIISIIIIQSTLFVKHLESMWKISRRCNASFISLIPKVRVPTTTRKLLFNDTDIMCHKRVQMRRKCMSLNPLSQMVYNKYLCVVTLRRAFPTCNACHERVQMTRNAYH